VPVGPWKEEAALLLCICFLCYTTAFPPFCEPQEPPLLHTHTQARELAQLLRSHDLMSHTNVIPWNPVDESEFARPSRNQVQGWGPVA